MRWWKYKCWICDGLDQSHPGQNTTCTRSVHPSVTHRNTLGVNLNYCHFQFQVSTSLNDWECWRPEVIITLSVQSKFQVSPGPMSLNDPINPHQGPHCLITAPRLRCSPRRGCCRQRSSLRPGPRLPRGSRLQGGEASPPALRLRVRSG